MSETESPATSPRQRIAAVTGAGGFIGSHLVEDLLAAGYRVRALVHYNAAATRGHLEEVFAGLAAEARQRLEIVAGDVCDARCVRDLVRGADAVFHLAALIGIPYSYAAPQSYVNTNIVGTLNVLEGCRDAGVPRLLHTSTSEVYGSALTTPMDETHPLQAQSPYSASKIAADKLAESYFLSFATPVTIVRPFNTFGPRQSLRAVIPTIIAQALSKDVPAIRLGSLDPVRDLTYVHDTARAFRMIAEAPAEKVIGVTYNLGVGRGISVGSLAQVILDVLDVKKPIEADDSRARPAASEVRLLVSDNRRIKREIGWKPETNLHDGIKATAKWMEPRLATIRVSEYAR